ncbi:hypothetical protein OQA88_7317 [Cercophora sp. LCS_1]
MAPHAQRRRRQVKAAEDSDEDVPSPNRESGGSDEDESMGAAGGDTSNLVKKMVRYALACEYSRTPIRRDGIKEKVLGPHGREFKKVFAAAQTQLRQTFGMEMVELPTKDRNLMTTEQKRKAAKSQSQREAASSAYVLTSILPAKYRTPEIIGPSKVHSPEGEAAYAALYTMIISIITLSGGELSDPRLRRHLTRLNALEFMPSSNPNNPESPSEKTELVLQRMVRQGYLVKLVENKGHGDDDEGTTWHVGPRGKVEVDNDAIVGFVRTVYGGSSEELDEELRASLVGTQQLQAVDEEPEVGNRESGDGDPGPSNRRRSRRHAAEEDGDGDEEMAG